MSVYKCLWLILLVGLSRAAEEVTVIRLQLSLEVEHQLTLNSSVEYMLDFTPNSEQMQYPSRILLRSNGGDTVHPILVTARQSTGAVSWQLPYISEGQVLYELESTLCPDDPTNVIADSECSAEALVAPQDSGILIDYQSYASSAMFKTWMDQAESFLRRNAFMLHVSSTCLVDVTMTVLATPVRDWSLPFQGSTQLAVGLAAPRVYFYQFRDAQESVRLVMDSEDEICALISIQNSTCPILQMANQLQLTGVRFSMLQSGGVHLSRSRYPNGFYVVTIVRASDTDCVGEETVNWLQQLGGLEEASQQEVARVKIVTIRVQASLTRGQYAIATAVTLTVFVLFYVMFYGVVLAQRWPFFAKFVSPKAPLVQLQLTESQLESRTAMQDTAQRRPRRSSLATFDSSDNSDSDEDDCDVPPPRDVTATNATTNNTAVSPPAVQTGASEVPNDTVVEGNGAVTQGNGNGHGLGGTRVSGTGYGEIAAEGRVTIVESNEVQSRLREVEQTPANPSNRDSTPFGLPHSLNLAALSRRRERVLRVRSDRYLYTLYTVALFYALPVVQFVTGFQIIFNVSGSLDLCYYNFLCSHPAGALSDFNHVFSNLGYLLLGALFMLQLRRRRQRRKRNPHEEYGIPAHYGLLSSLGAGMMVVGVLSASYHVCPNRLNFQFDTAFMYVLAVLTMVKIYQSRHPDVNARAHATFGVLAVLMAIVVWGVLGGGPYFWSIFTVIHLFTFLMLSLRIYYVGQFRLEKDTLQRAARQLAAMPRQGGVRPLYRARLVLLLIANGVNWGYAIWGLLVQSADFAGHLLQLLLLNALIHMVFYIVMKLLNKEKLRWYAWCFLAGAAAAWAPALYFFLSGSSDWSATAAVSRHLNHECKVLQFYDSHDLWHMLSALALYLSFNAMLTWDDGLAAVKRTDIAVF